MFVLVLIAAVVAIALVVVYRTLETRAKRVMWIPLAVIGWAGFGIYAVASGNAAMISAAVLLLIARLLAWHSDWPSPSSVGSWVSSI